MRIAVILFWLGVLLPLCGFLFVPDYVEGLAQVLITVALYVIAALCYLKARDRLRQIAPRDRLAASIINQQLRILSSFCSNISLFLVIGAILSPLLKDLLEHNNPDVDGSYILSMLVLSFMFQFLAINVISNYKNEDTSEDAKAQDPRG